MRSRYQDDTQARIDRVIGIPMGDGRMFRPGRNGGGTITSAQDAANAADTQARNAALAAETGPRPLGGYEGDSVRRAEAARLDPRSNPNLRPAAPVDPATQFVQQQLSALNGLVPGRSYTPEALARATPAQMQGELAALPARGRMVDDFLKRRQEEEGRRESMQLTGRADQMIKIGDQLEAGVGAGVLRPEVRREAEQFRGSPLDTFRRGGGRITPEIAAKAAFAKPDNPAGGFASAEEARKSIPAGSRGQVTQNAAGRWIVQYQVGDKEPVGFGSAEEAESSIPSGRRGTVKQNAAGRWVVSYGVGEPDQKAPSEREWMQERMAASLVKDTARLKRLGTNYKEFVANWRPGAADDTPPPAPAPAPSSGASLNPLNWLRSRTTTTAAPAPAAAPAAPAAPVQVRSRQERDKLPPGTRYVGPDGKIYTKQAAAPDSPPNTPAR